VLCTVCAAQFCIDIFLYAGFLVLNMVHLYLTGPYGAGKSTTAVALANLLNWPCIDPDQVFIDEFGDIGKFIQQHGWRKMIKKSSDILRALPKGDFVIPQVLFGNKDGEDIKEKDAQFCQKNGVLILILPDRSIAKSAEICYAREQKREYPISFEEVLERHKYSIPLLKKYADIIVYDNVSPENAALKIKSELQKRKII
jgi:shikimate kinase